MSIQSIKKRNGAIVRFDAEKIIHAIEAAFIEVRGGVENTLLENLSRQAMEEMEQRFVTSVPTVEDVQNAVEQVLMKDGFFDVAKAYIIYRYEHSKKRAAEEDEKHIMVIKRNGSSEKFSLDKIKRTLSYCVGELSSEINVEMVALQCQSEVYDGIKTSEVFKSLIMVARSMIELDPAYSKLAARLLNSRLQKEVIGEETVDFANRDAQYRATFISNLKQAISIGRLDARLLEFNLERLAEALKPERDDLFWYLGVQTLYDRYLIQDPNTHQVLETIQAFWMRVSMGIALNEQYKDDWAVKFYENISSLRFVPSTPTLFHAGTTHPQLSSCYLTTVEDSLDHIFKCISDNAQLSKWSGGLGNDWTNLRGTGAQIKGTGVESQGIIPFLKVANDTTAAINRSGRRRGATCAYLEVWHYDIESFTELRKNTGDERRRTHDMDTASWIPDLFMQRVAADGDWTLFSPDETPDLHHIYGRKFKERYEWYEEQVRQGKINLFKTIKARDLWKKILSMLFETGHPWVTFKDPSNIRSPQDHAGVVHNSNLCTEITLNTSADETAVCNLGSVNLVRHLRDKKLDTALLKDTVMLAMRMLDNVIDVNFYPTIEAKNSNMKHRPVGLGIMGFQDALYLLDIDFASERCVRFADQSMEVISYYAILASSELAHEKGAYSSYRGSKWDRGLFPVDTISLLEDERGEKIDVDRLATMDWTVVRESVRKYGMRNSNCMAIAPTATISNIAGSVPSIEPIYKNIYVKANQSGDFTVINNYLVADLKKLGLWNELMVKKIKYNDGNISTIEEIPLELRNKYKEAFQISPMWLVKAAAYRGKWIDQSQSLNIFYLGASGKEISDIYTYVWKMGLKTTYYLRTLAASQVEKSTVSIAEFGSTHKRSSAEGVTEGMTAPMPVMESIVAAPKITVPPNSIPVASFVPVTVPTPQSDVAPMPETPVSVMSFVDDQVVKLCRINDPTCEACQ